MMIIKKSVLSIAVLLASTWQLPVFAGGIAGGAATVQTQATPVPTAATPATAPVVKPTQATTLSAAQADATAFANGALSPMAGLVNPAGTADPKGMPGYSATAAQESLYAGNAPVTGAANAKINGCNGWTAPAGPNQMHEQGECDAVNFLAKKNLRQSKLPINAKTDPTLVAAGAVLKDAKNGTGLTLAGKQAGGFVGSNAPSPSTPAANQDACTTTTTTTPAPQILEYCYSVATAGNQAGSKEICHRYSPTTTQTTTTEKCHHFNPSSTSSCDETLNVTVTQPASSAATGTAQATMFPVGAQIASSFSGCPSNMSLIKAGGSPRNPLYNCVANIAITSLPAGTRMCAPFTGWGPGCPANWTLTKTGGSQTNPTYECIANQVIYSFPAGTMICQPFPSCPANWTLTKTGWSQTNPSYVCVAQIAVGETSGSACPAGSTLSGSTCYSCPAGMTLSGTMCIPPPVISASVTNGCATQQAAAL